MELKAFYISSFIVVNRLFAQFEAGLALIGDIIAVLSLLIVIIISFLSLRKMNRFDKLIPDMDQYIGKDEDGQIVMDERIVAVIDAVGSRFMKSFKMSALQGLSVNSKLEKGLKGAFAADIIDNKMPILNLLGDFMGYNVKQYVAKNPDALMQLLAMPQVQGFIGQYMKNNGVLATPSSSGSLGAL